MRDEGEAESDIEEVIGSAEHREALRADLGLRMALDRVASEVNRIPVELARAREKLWTPEKEKAPGEMKLWTPGTKESS
jgi:hypothetical protein